MRGTLSFSGVLGPRNKRIATLHPTVGKFEISIRPGMLFLGSPPKAEFPVARSWRGWQWVKSLQSDIQGSSLPSFTSPCCSVNVFLTGDPESVAGEYGRHSLYKMLGYFSLVGLLRLHSLLGDYYQAIKVLENIELNKKVITCFLCPSSQSQKVCLHLLGQIGRWKRTPSPG